MACIAVTGVYMKSEAYIVDFVDLVLSEAVTLEVFPEKERPTSLTRYNSTTTTCGRVSHLFPFIMFIFPTIYLLRFHYNG